MLIAVIFLMLFFGFCGVGYAGPSYGSFGYAGGGISLLFAIILILFLLKVI